LSFLRTVLGDVPAGDAGVTYAHEHIIIDPGFTTFTNPDFLLDSVTRACVDVEEWKAAGGRTLIDSMPCGAGRNAGKLAEISRRMGVNIVCPTGLHLKKYYPPGHWGERLSAQQLAALFIQDIQEGIDEFDYSGPSVSRSPYRAGVIKVATGLDKIDGHQQKVIEAAAEAHHTTGAPLLTHTEQGTAALDQVKRLQHLEVPLGSVCISHTDRQPDPVYHREILSTGVYVEYDSAFRWDERAMPGNPTLDLVVRMFENGLGDRVMLGMDAARNKYWHGYGGQPGLAFLLVTFVPRLRQAGLTQDDLDKIFIHNSAACYSFLPMGGKDLRKDQDR
jgi:predicted metal-dependent phosphotriesterase family hydrolase